MVHLSLEVKKIVESGYQDLIAFGSALGAKIQDRSV